MPNKLVIHSAIAIGILIISFELIPELIIVRTSGTVKSKTNPAPIRVLVDSIKAREISEKFILCKKKVTKQTITNIPPGKYKIEKLALIPCSPNIFKNSILKDNKKFFRISIVLERISKTARSTYGNQALILPNFLLVVGILIVLFSLNQ